MDVIVLPRQLEEGKQRVAGATSHLKNAYSVGALLKRKGGTSTLLYSTRLAQLISFSTFSIASSMQGKNSRPTHFLSMKNLSVWVP